MEPTDATLSRYVLGDLPPDQTETLDERSVIDPAFAERLRRVEHDLADAVARHELPAADLRRWARTVGASAGGRDELRLARALAARERGAASDGPIRALLRPARWTPTQIAGLASAAAVFLALAANFMFRAPTSVASVVENAPPTVMPSTKPPTAAKVPLPAPVPSFVAITLAAPTRSAADAPVLTIPAGTSEARVSLRIEPTEYTRFAVALRDVPSGSTVWRAGDLTPMAADGQRVLPLTLPVSMLHAGRFAFEVRGTAASDWEPIGTYPLTIHFNVQ